MAVQAQSSSGDRFAPLGADALRSGRSGPTPSQEARIELDCDTRSGQLSQEDSTAAVARRRFSGAAQGGGARDAQPIATKKLTYATRAYEKAKRTRNYMDAKESGFEALVRDDIRSAPNDRCIARLAYQMLHLAFNKAFPSKQRTLYDKAILRHTFRATRENIGNGMRQIALISSVAQRHFRTPRSAKKIDQLAQRTFQALQGLDRHLSYMEGKNRPFVLSDEILHMYRLRANNKLDINRKPLQRGGVGAVYTMPDHPNYLFKKYFSSSAMQLEAQRMAETAHFPHCPKVILVADDGVILEKIAGEDGAQAYIEKEKRSPVSQQVRNLVSQLYPLLCEYISEIGDAYPTLQIGAETLMEEFSLKIGAEKTLKLYEQSRPHLLKSRADQITGVIRAIQEILENERAFTRYMGAENSESLLEILECVRIELEAHITQEHAMACYRQHIVSTIEKQESTETCTAMKHQMLDILHGLVDLERDGFIAGDLKPDNIMIDGYRARFIDTGGFSRIGEHLGCFTPTYLDPSFKRWHSTSSSMDIWSFGATFLDMIIGESGATYKLMKHAQYQGLDIQQWLEPVLDAIPDHRIREVLKNSLRFNPQDRLSARDLIDIVAERHRASVGCFG